MSRAAFAALRYHPTKLALHEYDSRYTPAESTASEAADFSYDCTSPVLFSYYASNSCPPSGSTRLVTSCDHVESNNSSAEPKILSKMRSSEITLSGACDASECADVGRPRLTYSDLACEAMTNSEDGSATLKDIYSYIVERYPFFQTYKRVNVN